MFIYSPREVLFHCHCWSSWSILFLSLLLMKNLVLLSSSFSFLVATNHLLFLGGSFSSFSHFFWFVLMFVRNEETSNDMFWSSSQVRKGYALLHCWHLGQLLTPSPSIIQALLTPSASIVLRTPYTFCLSFLYSIVQNMLPFLHLNTLKLLLYATCRLQF